MHLDSNAAFWNVQFEIQSELPTVAGSYQSGKKATKFDPEMKYLKLIVSNQLPGESWSIGSWTKTLSISSCTSFGAICTNCCINFN